MPERVDLAGHVSKGGADDHPDTVGGQQYEEGECQGDVEAVSKPYQNIAATVESTVSIACFLKDAQLAKEIAAGLMKNRVVAGVRIRASGALLHGAGSQASAAGSKGAVREITRTVYSPFDAQEAVGGITLFVSRAEIEAQAIAYSRYTTWMLGLQVAIVAASGWAPPIPPRPAVRIVRPASEPDPKCVSPAAANV